MQAVILAAGNSERFYPFNTYSHKAMVQLLGKPILVHTLASIKTSGIKDVVIVVKKDSSIPKEIGDGKEYGLKITYVIQHQTLGMGNALLAAQEYLHDEFFLLSAYHFEFHEFKNDMQKKKQKDNEVVLLAKKDSIFAQYGILQTEKDKVSGFIEKPGSAKESNLRVISVYLLNKFFLQTLKSIPTAQYHFEKALDIYAREGNVSFIETQKQTVTLKYPWDLLGVKDHLLTDSKPYISKTASISKHAIIQGPVIIEDNVQITEGACIKGPCFLGKGVVIGNNAILRNGVIVEEGAVVGANMEIKNTIIMQNTKTHFGFIGDSVIGNNGKIAGSVCTANARLDRNPVGVEVKGTKVNSNLARLGIIVGNNVNVGVNVSFMPGIIVGNHVTIGPSTTIMQNIPDNSLIYTKFETVSKNQ